MSSIVLEAMRAGAIGFSTSTSPAHNGDGGTADALAACRRRRAARAGRRACSEAGRGVFMLTKGGHTTHGVPRGARGRIDAAGGGRGAAPQQHQSRRACSATSTRSPQRERARPAPRRRGVVLPAVDGLHAALALHVRGAGVLAAGAAAEGRRVRGEAGGKAFRDAVREELARPAHFRLFNGEWDKVHVIESAPPRRRAAPDRRARARGRRRSARLHARPRARGKPRHGLQRAAAQLRRGGGRPDAAPSGEPGVAFRRRARTSPSSTTPASACICSATGCASAAR